MLSFKPAFSFSSFTFIKRFFSSSSLSAIRVVSAYLRLLIFLPAILIPAYTSYSLAFLMMYSAYKLNKQGDNIQHCHCYSITQSCPTLCDPIDRNPPGSSIHGIFQARVLEWVAIAFSVCISEVIAISPGNPNSSLCFIQPGISHDVL